MKAVVLHQPYATLVALGIKTIETRPSPPNGPMRPDGVRGLPGLPIDRGERIAIVAGAKRPDPMVDLGREWRVIYEADAYGELDTVWAVTHRTRGYHLLPLGAVVCTVVVDDALPMVRWDEGGPSGTTDESPVLELGTPDGDEVLTLWPRGDVEGSEVPFTDQLPYGDYAPGRWGWMLSDPRPCDPIPCKGRQGVFRLPDEIAEALP